MVDGPQSVLDLSKPFDGLPKGGLASLLLGNKRKFAQLEDDDDGHVEKRIALASQSGATPIVTNGPDGLLPAQAQPAVSGQQPTPEFIRPAVLNPVLSVSQLRLRQPAHRFRHGLRKFDGLPLPRHRGRQGCAIPGRDIIAHDQDGHRAQDLTRCEMPSGA